MRFSLSDTIWLSDKRQRLLLLLMEGPRNIDQIKTSLNVTSKSMMPQINKLKEQNLIINHKEDGSYRLSSIGRITVRNMMPLLRTLGVLEENNEYWASMDLTTIPDELACRLGELGECMVIDPDVNHLFDLPLEFTENLKRSHHVRSFISYFHPLYPSLYSELSQRGADLELILTRPVFERMKENCYNELQTMMDSENTKIYICDDEMKLTITLTERFIYICFFNDEGRYDHKKVMSFDESALRWGNELIDNYITISGLLDDL